jgi:PAS domain S-box-containing protein
MPGKDLQFIRSLMTTPLGQVLERINQVFWVCSADLSETLYVSPAYEEIWGRPTQDLYSRPESFTSPICPEDRERVLAAVERLLAGVEMDEEYRIARPDGSIRWIHDRAFGLRDSEGQLYCLAGIAEDITERKQAEVASHESELQLRLALNAAGLGTWDWNLETNLVTWSERTEEIFGYAPGTFPGTYEGFIARVHPSDRDMVSLECARSVSEKIPCGFEYRLLLPDGTVRWVAEKGDFLKDETGQPRHLCGVMKDITSRKIAEEALRKSEEQFRRVFDEAPIGMGLTGSDGCFFKANRAFIEMLGYTESELKTFKCSDITHPEDLKHEIPYVQQVKRGEIDSFQLETRFFKKNQEIVWVNLTLMMLRGKAGEILYTLGMVEDITVRKIAEEEIIKALQRERELSEAKSRFIAMTSHDLRTPLTTIQSSLDLLKHRSKLSEERQQTHLDRIESAVIKMTGMVQDVLILSEASAGKLQFNPFPVDLVQLCRTLVSELQFANTHQHSLTFAVSDECGTRELLLDSKLVRYILINLLTNASKYSSQGSPIQFDLTYHPESVVFRIQDQGIGIPPEDIPHLFECFYRASNAGTFQGTGLGLAIVKQCVDLHSGEITVDSVVGEGTTFTVTLPLSNNGIHSSKTF